MTTVPNIDAEQLATSLRQLGKTATDDIGAAINEAVLAAVTLFSVQGSGVMIADQENSLRYVAASGESSRVMEQTQTEAGEGPCVSAFVTNELVTTADLRADERWPAVRPTFVRHGVISVLGVPLRLGGVPVGSLDVYRDHPHQWDESERAALARYGDVVETVLGTALAAHRADELADQLQYALDYRVVIERAVGFLMARRRLDAVQAFDQLRRHARSHRRKVADVARELLETGSLPAAGTPERPRD